MEDADGGNAFISTQKRRYSQTDGTAADASLNLSTEPKQRKTEVPLQPARCHNLLSFCDEVLYEIFKYLDSWALLALMNCSPRFENLLLDHRFWHHIDLSNGPLPLGILEEILGRATEKTRTIKICGPPSSQHVVGEFKQFTCTLTTVFPKVAKQLQVLELQGVSLDFEYIHISEFPSSLKRLVLKDCSVKVGEHVKSIFHTIENQLVDLEDLSIEDNYWFEPFYIMALSKLPSLRRLSLKGCQMMCKFVPYGSMAARFGFQKLEVLDLRLTPINNSDLQCFSAIESLKELLLESPPYTAPEAAIPNKKKTSNSNGSDETAATQSESRLSDDEPSTSRAALELLRACNSAKDKLKDLNANSSSPPSSTDASKTSNTFNSDNCNERKVDNDNGDYGNSSPPVHKSGQCAASESDEDLDDDDEEDESTSASTDDSDMASGHSIGHNGERVTSYVNNAQARSPLVVIALPGVAAERPTDPPGPAGSTPRAYIYVPDAHNAAGEGGRPDAHMNSVLEQMATHMRAAAHNWRGNQPAHSHFLPRRDQVIYMNPQAVTIREPLLVMHSRRTRARPRGDFDHVVQHPMFWNMLDPLDRDYARRIRTRPYISPVPAQYFVSDRAIYSFGRAANPVQPDVVWIRNINRSPNNRLERIQLRNYPHITNHTLEHLVQCSPNLIYIDVSGTAVTAAGIRNFKKIKPECEVIAAHLSVDAEQVEDNSAETPVTDDADIQQAAPEPPSTSPPPALHMPQAEEQP